MRPDIAGPVPMPLHEQAPGERDGCPAPSGCARPAVKRVRIVRPSSLIEPGDRLVMPLRRTVVEPTPLAFGAAIFVRYASDFCLLAAAARNGESVPGTVLSICSKVREHQTGWLGLSVPAAPRHFAPVREALGIQIYSITRYLQAEGETGSHAYSNRVWSLAMVSARAILTAVSCLLLVFGFRPTAASAQSDTGRDVISNAMAAVVAVRVTERSADSAAR